ncbi:MAG: ABC transporter ATP-binding protein, partial [Chloroflexi bacterium]|nr:ABC transporter ATP-binding protein [Chloroflexota bacterium]
MNDAVPLLEGRAITKTFVSGTFRKRHNLALDEISLTINESPPTITAIAGESGSGKTTLARVLLGLLRPTSGQVVYRGRDVARMGRREFREFRREVQVIFQDPFEAYNPFYKIDHVLSTPIRKYKLANTKSQAHDLAVEALETVGLRPDETLGRYPHQLSGGQRQRIMVARAVMLRPKIIVADEPVSMVDASLRATILETLRTLNDEFGISILYITHDLTTAYQIAENIIVLYKGTVAEAGDVEKVINSPTHPYTRLLFESIPQPNPDLQSGSSAASSVLTGGRSDTGCVFYDR